MSQSDGQIQDGDDQDDRIFKLISDLEITTGSVLDFRISDETNPLESFKFQEIQLYNNLKATISKDIIQLKQSLKGQIVLSEYSERIYNDLLSSRIPISWQELSY